MTARQPWSGADYDSWLDRNLPDDEPTTQTGLAQAVRDDLDRLCRELAKPNPDQCDLHDMWVDIVANAVEGREIARIRAMD